MNEKKKVVLSAEPLSHKENDLVNLVKIAHILATVQPSNHFVPNPLKEGKGTQFFSLLQYKRSADLASSLAFTKINKPKKYITVLP